MLNSVVPIPLSCVVTRGVAADASIANKSKSGSVNFTFDDQLVPASSRHSLPSKRTINPVAGAITLSALRLTPGLAVPTASRCKVVVRLPDMKGAA